MRRAVGDLGVPYPVALDPDFATWDAFGTRYWPTTYLIDRDGRVRDLHVGEGDEERTEDYVRRALAVPATRPRASAAGRERPPGYDVRITPETWLGTGRIDRLAPGQEPRPVATAFGAPGRLAPDHVAFDGTWTVGREAAQAGPAAALELAFRARRVHLVLDGDGRRRPGRVLLDGRPVRAVDAGRDVRPGGRLPVSAPRLYRLVDLPRVRSGRLRVELAPGTRAYAFTSG